MSDGSVKIEVEGDDTAILSLVDYIKNDVRWAKVKDIQIKWEDFKGKYRSFEILG